MSTLRLPGLLTGIDTNTLIAQLMAIERRTLTTYQKRVSAWQDKKDALSDLESKLTALRSTVSALSDAAKLRAFGIVSSDEDILTAEATNKAFEGNHTIIINQLAKADRWVHTAGFEYADDYVSDQPGTFIYSYNGKETVITTTSTTTLEDLVGLINNDADNPGVTASLLHYGNTYHLVLNGNDAGSDYCISVNASSTEVLQADSAFTVDSDNATLSTRITKLDQFDEEHYPLEAGEKIKINGTDHYGRDIAEVELDLTKNTKLSHLIDKIKQAFDGNVKVTLENGKIVVADVFSGDSAPTISLDYSNDNRPDLPTMVVSTEGGTDATLSGFGPSAFTRTQAAQDSKIKVDGFPSVAAVPEVQQIQHTPALTAGGSNDKFTLSYGGYTTVELDYDATIDEIQDALDDLPGVQQGEITVGGEPLNVDGTLTFTFADTLGDVSMILIDSSGLSQTLSVSEQTKGVDEYISRSSNTIDDVLYGVTLHLHDITDVTGEEITLTRDVQSVKDKLNAMVNAYNAAVIFIKEKTGYNDVLKTAGILMGDYVVGTIRNRLLTPLIAQTTGFVTDIDSFLMPGQIGLQLDSDGTLSLDTNQFDEAIAEDYMGVLAVIGANKTGSSDSNTVQFYGASETYTSAGTYNVEVTVSGSKITVARIKLSSDSTWRDATFSGNIVTGNSTFDENGDPVYSENSLKLSVDLSQDGTFTATVRVKQGFAGALEDALDKMLKASTGSIDIDQEHIDDTIKNLQDRIADEQYRLDQKESRLIEKFARLERTLALLQGQLSALGLSTAS
jgi:flagellar hook-associated protein 2